MRAHRGRRLAALAAFLAACEPISTSQARSARSVSARTSPAWWAVAAAACGASTEALHGTQPPSQRPSHTPGRCPTSPSGHAAHAGSRARACCCRSARASPTRRWRRRRWWCAEQPTRHCALLGPSSHASTRPACLRGGAGRAGPRSRVRGARSAGSSCSCWMAAGSCGVQCCACTAARAGRPATASNTAVARDRGLGSYDIDHPHSASPLGTQVAGRIGEDSRLLRRSRKLVHAGCNQRISDPMSLPSALRRSGCSRRPQ